MISQILKSCLGPCWDFIAFPLWHCTSTECLKLLNLNQDFGRNLWQKWSVQKYLKKYTAFQNFLCYLLNILHQNFVSKAASCKRSHWKVCLIFNSLQGIQPFFSLGKRWSCVTKIPSNISRSSAESCNASSVKPLIFAVISMHVYSSWHMKSLGIIWVCRLWNKPIFGSESGCQITLLG